MTRSRLRPLSPTLFTSPIPPPREPSPRPSSVLEDCDGESIMSTNSRPSSLALMPPAGLSGPMSPPSLRDILTDTASPPYTLGAFMAFLSQNHCLETLEFTMDAERYRTTYADAAGDWTGNMGDSNEHLCTLWQKLMHAYIQPCGTREVNLPSHVRDRLLSLPSVAVPPNPSELDEAVRIVYELMNDSVLGPFVASVAPQEEVAHDHRLPRSRLRIPKDSGASSSGEESRSPISGFLPMLNLAWASEPKSSSSSASDPNEHGGLSEDSGSASAPSPPTQEPMTPPTTPPTSDWGFSSTSPGSLQRAISAHNSGWKKMGAKLGLSRKGRNKRTHASSVTSAGADPDLSTGESASQGTSSPL